MPDNQLAYLDQAMFDGHRVTGQNEIMQALWVYEHPLDYDGLRRIHANLSKGLMGRLIERSPLPFGRHRWVEDTQPPGIDIATTPRPRSEVGEWADERTRIPIDAERGPGWHLGVQPLTNGSTAVSLVLSHYVVDGVGLFVALFEASLGMSRDFGYPPPRSRSRAGAVVQDLRRTGQDMPDALRALGAAAKMGVGYWGNARPQTAPHAPAPSASEAREQSDDDHEHYIVPWVSVQVKADEWQDRARALGGTTNTLAAGLAARLGQRMGRVRAADGNIALIVLSSNRGADDSRALALSYPRIVVDPTTVTSDLTAVRAAVKEALKNHRETQDESSRFAPLTLFAPKRFLKQMVEASLIEPDRPVVYSHLGETPPGASGVDGTDAEYVTARGTKQRLTRQWLDKTGGQAILLSAHFPGRISLNFQAYEPGADNTKAAVARLVAEALSDFDLTGDIE